MDINDNTIKVSKSRMTVNTSKVDTVEIDSKLEMNSEEIKYIEVEND